MTSRSLTFDLPEEIIALIGSPDDAAARARTALLMELLREGSISQGQAAGALGVTIRDLLDLMKEHDVPSGPESPEDVRQDVEDARRALYQP